MTKQFDMLTDVFDGIDLGAFKPLPLTSDGGSSSHKMLCLTDRGAASELNEAQWDQAQQMLMQGKLAYKKLIKEAQRLLGLIGNNKTDHLYTLLLKTWFELT